MNPKLKRELKFISGMADTLYALSAEVEELGGFDSDSEGLLKEIGSSILFHGISVGWQDGLQTKRGEK